MPHKALIITSNQQLCQDIEDSLQGLSLEFHHADGYMQALSMVARYHYILVVMDLSFSEISGVDLIRRMRELEQTPTWFVNPRYQLRGSGDAECRCGSVSRFRPSLRHREMPCQCRGNHAAVSDYGYQVLCFYFDLRERLENQLQFEKGIFRWTGSKTHTQGVCRPLQPGKAHG